MAKILFVPTNSREVTQFSLVKHELGREPDWDVLSIALNDKMELLLHQEGFSPKRIADYRTWDLLNIIKQEKPEILITDFVGPIPNALIYAANHAGIPCLQIDDGVTSERLALEKVSLGQSLLRIMRGLLKHIRGLSCLLVTLMAIENPLQFMAKVKEEIRRYVFHPYTSYTEGLNIAVLSQFAKDAYISMGVPPERVFITGQPRFDLIWQKKPKPKEQVLIELGMPETKGVIVLATQPLVKMRIWTERQREQLVQAAVSAVKEFPDKQLVIKLHPDESIETYREILTKIGEDKVIVCRDVNLYELLNACDLLMTVHSTVGLEAMLFAKPVIVVNFTGRPCVMGYAESGAAINVCKEEDLAPAIWKALYDPQIREELTQYRKKFINEHVYKLDGQASKRVAELIVELIKKAKVSEGEARNIKVKMANQTASNSSEETKSLSAIVREERQFFDRIALRYDNMVGLCLPIEELGTVRRVNDLKKIINYYVYRHNRKPPSS